MHFFNKSDKWTGCIICSYSPFLLNSSFIDGHTLTVKKRALDVKRGRLSRLRNINRLINDWYETTLITCPLLHLRLQSPFSWLERFTQKMGVIISAYYVSTVSNTIYRDSITFRRWWTRSTTLRSMPLDPNTIYRCMDVNRFELRFATNRISANEAALLIMCFNSKVKTLLFTKWECSLMEGRSRRSHKILPQ